MSSGAEPIRAPRTIVIGGGIAGLAASVLLAAASIAVAGVVHVRWSPTGVTRPLADYLDEQLELLGR